MDQTRTGRLTRSADEKDPDGTPATTEGAQKLEEYKKRERNGEVKDAGVQTDDLLVKEQAS